MEEAMTKMMTMKMKDEDGMDGRSLHGESGCVRVCSSFDMCFLLLPGPEKKRAFFLLISKKKKPAYVFICMFQSTWIGVSRSSWDSHCCFLLWANRRKL